MTEIEKRVSGFRVKGSWSQVVTLGELITTALIEQGNDDEHVEDWNEWRPRLDDKIQEDINERTSEKASLDKNEVEEEIDEPKDEIKKASNNVGKAYENIDDEPQEEIKSAIKRVINVSRTLTRKAMRDSEEKVYENIMTLMSPYYFDNEIISASIKESTGFRKTEKEYVFEINVNDDQLKTQVSEYVDEYDNDISVWYEEIQEEVKEEETEACNTDIELYEIPEQ